MQVKPAAGYRKTTTSDNAGPTATADSESKLGEQSCVDVASVSDLVADPLANPFL
jgi:hypothetical protein